ncbi:hypothetical protein AQUSIP_26220 [Aquicella siphonis]|uniref:CoA-binding domain-containing protein n=1 Tax=Aquicella siphonis TaxID=254247 RepID=A0A5E4PL93_9COXI|nr:CoA-binding protein [Aquicella siphonis]VVC77295.1 hypothetical protein AQUSIP_26220 [Aquicella siphonis]
MNNDALDKQIESFFNSEAYGVAGASNHREKYGNKVLRVYLQRKKKVYPVNPREKIIEGVPCVPDVFSLPDEVKSLSIITPPPVTEIIVIQAIQKGIRNIWMQPGAESISAIQLCQSRNVNIISGGPCILVVLGFHED